MDDGWVDLYEMRDDADLDYLTGCFETRWTPMQGGGAYDGPSGFSLTDALAWGRERAAVILVRLDSDEWYSAGPEPREGLPTLPRGFAPTRRRSAHSSA
jgi:hypothetical protein